MKRTVTNLGVRQTLGTAWGGISRFLGPIQCPWTDRSILRRPARESYPSIEGEIQ
jgi:hypothetical protein